VPLRSACDFIITLGYKLQMFGIPLDKNTSIPESVLSKEHNAVNYHAVREAVAAGILEIHKEDTQTNLADLLTKELQADWRHELLGSILFNL